MKFTKYILFISVLGSLLSCSITKNVPEGEYVLYERKIEGVKLSNEETLSSIISQEPNTRIPFSNRSLGVSIYRVGNRFYDSAKVADKLKSKQLELEEIQLLRDSLPEDRKLQKRQDKLNTQIEGLEEKLEFGNLVMRTGNPVVLLDSTKTRDSAKEIGDYLVNHGFFDATSTYKVETKEEKAFVTYVIDEKKPYLIDSVYTRTDNVEILQILKANSSKSEIKAGEMYNQDNISRERSRVEYLLKNNGFFMFSDSYIEYNVYQDTSAKRVAIEQVIFKPSFAEKHRIFTIDSIYFQVAPPSNEFVDQKVKRNYRDIDFSFYRDRYSAKLFASRVFFNVGKPYNRSEIIDTQKQLNNLDLFRFLNISFDTLGTSLTAKVIAQPNQKFQLTNQVGLSVTEQLPGPFFSSSLRNRNFFSAGEILEFNFRAGLEGVASATNQGVYQSRELGVSGAVIFPRFLIPFAPGTLAKFGRYNPNTRTSIGYSYTNRPEYTRSSLNSQLAYTWATTNNKMQFTVNAADIAYIRTPNITEEFFQILQDLQSEGNNLIWSFLPSFVSSFSVQSVINFNQYGNFKNNSASLLRLYAESGGTSLNFFEVPSNDEEDIEFANFQWLKFQADYRKYLPLDAKQTIAYRVNFGIAKPYGVSAGILPYEKYFFAGGSSSIRAWQARRLGPGSSIPTTDENGNFTYNNEQPAEMIMESMLEYRRKLFGYFNMAFFVDLGNSWSIGYDQARPGADFEYDRFYKEIAVGTGIGLRMDFDFLVIRLDLATKAVDPAQSLGNRWVLDNLTWQKPLGEKGQTVLNFGIGYPF